MTPRLPSCNAALHCAFDRRRRDDQHDCCSRVVISARRADRPSARAVRSPLSSGSYHNNSSPHAPLRAAQSAASGRATDWPGHFIWSWIKPRRLGRGNYAAVAIKSTRPPPLAVVARMDFNNDFRLFNASFRLHLVAQRRAAHGRSTRCQDQAVVTLVSCCYQHRWQLESGRPPVL